MNIQNSTWENEEKHSYYMRLALLEAEKALQENEVPVGAVLVRGEDILARGYNKTEQKKSPLAHAEMLVLEEACRKEASLKWKGWRLLDTILYVTLEPCSMCAGALVLARIKQVVFSLKDRKSGACGSVFNIVQEPKLNHRIDVVSCVCSEDSLALLQKFFQAKRNRK